MIASLFFLPAIALGCSFSQEADIFRTPGENAPEYTYIFHGEVIEREQSERQFEDTRYVIRVNEDIMGNLPRVLVIDSPIHSCGWFTEIGTSGFFFLNDLESIDESTPKYYPNNDPEYEAILSEVRSALDIKTPQACTKEYRPVCAERVVQCVQAPCPPVQETASNRCVADSQGLSVLYEGECTVETTQPKIETNVPRVPETITVFVEPESGPPTDFREPTSPPPSQEETVQREMTFWEKVRFFFSGLFFWR